MKNTVLFLIFVLGSMPVYSQVNWQQGYNLEDILPNPPIVGADEATGLIVDESGIYFISSSGCGTPISCIGFYKVDKETGEVLIKKHYEDTEADSYLFTANVSNFIKTQDDHFIITGGGFRGGDYVPFLMKIDKEGNQVWLHFYETTESAIDFSHGVQELPDGSFLLSTGGTTTDQHSKISILKISQEGLLEWFKSYDFSDYLISPGYGNVIVLPSGEMMAYLSGRDPVELSHYVWVAKFDSGGTLLWVKRSFSRETLSHKVIMNAPDGNVLLMARLDTIVSGGNQNEVVTITKIDTAGHTLWAYPYVSKHALAGFGISLTAEGDILVCGPLRLAAGIYTEAAAWFTKLSADGELLWEHSYTGDLQYEEGLTVLANQLKEAPDGSLIGVGLITRLTESGLQNRDAWALKLDADGCYYPDNCNLYNYIATANEEVRLPDKTIHIYPNPSTNGRFTLEIDSDVPAFEVFIYNQLGALMTHRSMTDKSQDFDLPYAGLFYVSIKADGYQLATKKIVNIGW